ncbi:MAG: hypothetical protein J6S14_15870 [Clostridia bacterium]|nr:hypothetical protein [Clostridia bacterium]
MEERRNLYLGDGTHFQMIMTDVTEDEMRMAIRAHLANTERPSHYLRYWEEDGVRWLDYGSWSAFFIWATRENYEKLLLRNKEMEENNE